MPGGAEARHKTERKKSYVVQAERRKRQLLRVTIWAHGFSLLEPFTEHLEFFFSCRPCERLAKRCDWTAQEA